LVLFLIRYNELGLKSPRVRRRFQKRLIKNIEDKFLKAELDCFIESDWGRIYLTTDNQLQGLKLLKTVFGIFSISPVVNFSDDLDEITSAAVDYAKDLLTMGQSFALRTRRTGQHKYTSQDIANHVGAAILNGLKDRKLTVNLSAPDVEIFIEVRQKNSYIFSESFPGPGGLPLGTQGKVISIFTDKNSYIATWLMMKRGCRAYPVYFKSKNNKPQLNESKAMSQIELLTPWAPNLKLKIIEDNGKQNDKENAINLKNKEFQDFANRVRAKGICSSLDLNDFSKVIHILRNELPIFYPLIGLDKEMVKNLGNMIRDI